MLAEMSNDAAAEKAGSAENGDDADALGDRGPRVWALPSVARP